MKYEEYLDTYGQLTYRFQGTSMMPLLRQGKDAFTVAKKTAARCKKYDVVLYRRKEQYVLHRVVEVTPEGYVILGDNCLYKERDIPEENILGVMTSFTRNGRTVSANHWGYRLYSRVWYFLYPLRFGILRSIMWLRSKI